MTDNNYFMRTVIFAVFCELQPSNQAIGLLLQAKAPQRLSEEGHTSVVHPHLVVDSLICDDPTRRRGYIQTVADHPISP